MRRGDLWTGGFTLLKETSWYTMRGVVDFAEGKSFPREYHHSWTTIQQGDYESGRLIQAAHPTFGTWMMDHWRPV